jgi:cell division protein ZapA (FtsZ GTPase activity inhibitor)
MNRPYPLLVRGEEEESVRNAAKLINDRIKVYKEKFSVQDEMDLVVMCCLELATDNLNQAQRSKAGFDTALEALEKVDDALNGAILNVEESAPAAR